MAFKMKGYQAHSGSPMKQDSGPQPTEENKAKYRKLMDAYNQAQKNRDSRAIDSLKTKIENLSGGWSWEDR